MTSRQEWPNFGAKRAQKPVIHIKQLPKNWRINNTAESMTNSITPCLLLQFPKHRMSITSAASTAVSTGSTSGGTTSVGGGVNSVAATADHRPPFIQNSVRAATSPGLINDDSSTAVSRWLYFFQCTYTNFIMLLEYISRTLVTLRYYLVVLM